MLDVLRALLFILSVITTLMLVKVMVVIKRPGSRLGDHNVQGRLTLVLALAMLTISCGAELYFRLGTEFTWRTPMFGGGIVMASLRTWFTFYKPGE